MPIIQRIDVPRPRTLPLRQTAVVFLVWFFFAEVAVGQIAETNVVEIHAPLTHLRSTEQREWGSFPPLAEQQSLECEFQSSINVDPWTLTLRQEDVKEAWNVKLNGHSIGKLVRDENDLWTDFVVPAGALKDGPNTLLIEQAGRKSPDDIRVGQIQLRSLSPKKFRRQATVQIAIADPQNRPLPGRVTVVDQNGTLVPVGASSHDHLAVREGVVYTSTGIAEFGVTPGDYRIHAGRGFEYSVASTRLRIEAGQLAKRTLTLVRQVNTEGWIACDTHVHTVTHSGHGDATIEERMATLAGEGIELPIATDHNKHIDYRPITSDSPATKYFTPVIGNEVTTAQGHFNIFPIRKDSSVPDHRETDWSKLSENLFAVPDVRVSILNHGRDIHSGFRPFSPRHHISISGQNLDDRVLPANAMELINSGAVQTDPMQLFGDWCGLINRGHEITPVGSSDSHDVSRFIVGQGRTYIRGEDSDPATIDVAAATESFAQGRVSVSYGLFATVWVGEDDGPGDLAQLEDGDTEIHVRAELAGPHWTKPRSIQLFVNGIPRAEEEVTKKTEDSGGWTASHHWRLSRDEYSYDLWVAVAAMGKGVDAPYWPTAKPYQPDSIEFTPYTFASTGPVRIDADGDGQFASAFQYARDIVAESSGSAKAIAERLSGFDDSVAIQTASILLGEDVDPELFQRTLDSADDRVRAAVRKYQRAQQQSIVAQAERTE